MKSYKYRSARELASAMTSLGKTTAAYAEVKRGMDSWLANEIVPRRTINFAEVDERHTRKRYTRPYSRTANTQNPGLVGCGNTRPLTPGGGARPYWQSVVGIEQPIKFCIYDCDEHTLSRHMSEENPNDGSRSLLFEVGASFGRAYQQYIFAGDEQQENWHGLFSTNYAQVVDYRQAYTNDTAYLDEKSDVEQANFFTSILRPMERPRILLDQSIMRVLGDAKVGTNDCGTKKWNCMLEVLAADGYSRDIFRMVEGLDQVLGIDPAASGDKKATIAVVDEANVGFAVDGMGALDAQDLDGNKDAEMQYYTYFGGLEVDREKSVKAFYDVVDPVKLEADYDLRWTAFEDDEKPFISIV